MPDSQFDIDQAVQELQPLGAPGDLKLQAGQLDVESLLQACRGHVSGGAHRLGQVGEPFRQLQHRSLCVGQPELAHQFFARRGGGVLRGCELGCRVGVEHLLACALQLGEVPDLLQAACQFGARLRGAIDLVGVLQCLLRGYGAHPCLADLADLIHHRCAEPGFGLRDLVACDELALRQRQQVEQPERQQAAEFQLVDRSHPLESKDRVCEASAS